MKIFLLTSILVISSFSLFSKANKSDSLLYQINKIQLEINQLKKQQDCQSGVNEKTNEKISYQKDQIDYQIAMLDTAFDGVSDQIGATSIFLTIWGIVVGIISLLVGYYVNKIKKNIEKIKTETEELLNKNIQLKLSMEELSRRITQDSTGLYKIIRDEESKHIIERLISVPQDISNVNSILLSRELQADLFPNLKEAYTQVKAEYRAKEAYLILFFQHFSGATILDSDIKNDLLDGLPMVISSAFKNDIIKSTEDYFNAIIANGIQKSNNEINKFAEAISSSKYATTEEVYFSIYKILEHRDIRFLLYKTIIKNEPTKPFRKGYGNLLLEYKLEAPTAEEAQIFSEIEHL